MGTAVGVEVADGVADGVGVVDPDELGDDDEVLRAISKFTRVLKFGTPMPVVMSKPGSALQPPRLMMSLSPMVTSVMAEELAVS
ncbi:unannotated protein [freshwater metagenome]|uniref:Unannotated protein n=1 Tax=freshwater metagenome TaxID=449393 RepID=A0A6J6MS20_9ZZZZ